MLSRRELARPLPDTASVVAGPGATARAVKTAPPVTAQAYGGPAVTVRPVTATGTTPATPNDGKATAEVHDCHDELAGVLASSLAKRAPATPASAFPTPQTPLYARLPFFRLIQSEEQPMKQITEFRLKLGL